MNKNSIQTKVKSWIGALASIGPARIALIAMAGVVLLLTSSPGHLITGRYTSADRSSTGSGSKFSTADGHSFGLTGSRSGSGGGSSAQSDYIDQENYTNEEYVSNLENKLKHILRQVDGVGQVEVMITLRSSEEQVLNKDISKEESKEEDTKEDDDHISHSVKQDEETILTGGSGDDEPYVVKRLKPEIAGILIICQGAGSNQIKASVTQAAEAVFQVAPSHIKVLKMEDQS